MCAMRFEVYIGLIEVFSGELHIQNADLLAKEDPQLCLKPHLLG